MTVQLTRRRFLQLSAAGIGATAAAQLVSGLQAFAAPPLGATDGVLVVVMLGGGNDGLNTVCPVGDARYYSLRPGLAIPASQALPIGEGLGLHPSLAKLKRRFDAGKVAVVRGAGYSPADLSHFESMDIWMRGWGAAGGPQNGWLGRYLDGLPNAQSESLYAVSVSGSAPRHLAGAVGRASTLPLSIDGAFGIDRKDAAEARLFDAVASYGTGTSGLGSLGDLYGDTMQSLMQLTQKIRPAYGHDGPDSDIGRQLALCAHLVNANLGIRVLHTGFGSFDTHSDQPWQHAQLLADLDEGIEAFFAALAPAWRGRVTLMTFSEFGRRPQVNGDRGTDHGTASVMFVAGDAVRGGLHGAQPSLRNLDGNGNLVPTVDFRAVYAGVLGRWLDADDQEILGARYTPVDLFARRPAASVPTPPSAPKPGTPSVPPAPGGGLSGTGYWLAGPDGSLVARGAATAFGNLPPVARPVLGGAATASGRGLWLCASDGGIFALGDARFHGSMGGQPLNRPVVAMAATRTGKGYWLCASDGGIFAFGDARFYGSTGAMRLNKPIVAMAATPSGRGYWLCASDGGIFAFGDAQFCGSTGAIPLVRPIVAMAATPSGRGYWLCASDGGIFAFGDAQFRGAATGAGDGICSMARTPSGRGYWIAADDGRVWPFGDARDFGRREGRTAVLVA